MNATQKQTKVQLQAKIDWLLAENEELRMRIKHLRDEQDKSQRRASFALRAPRAPVRSMVPVSPFKW